MNSFLLYLILMDRLLAYRPQNMVEAAINHSQLAFFIIANLLTGLINLVTWTYYANEIIAYSVMLLYVFAVVTIHNMCKKHKIRVI